MAVGAGLPGSYAIVSTGCASPNVVIRAPLVVSVAVRSKTGEAAMSDAGTPAVVDTTETAAIEETAPGPKLIVARPSVLAAIPPVAGVTSAVAAAGGPRPLPGFAAGSGGARSAATGAAVA